MKLFFLYKCCYTVHIPRDATHFLIWRLSAKLKNVYTQRRDKKLQNSCSEGGLLAHLPELLHRTSLWRRKGNRIPTKITPQRRSSSSNRRNVEPLYFINHSVLCAIKRSASCLGATFRDRNVFDKFINTPEFINTTNLLRHLIDGLLVR